MPGPPSQPILVRDDAVVATAVGVSDPSLTLVEFNTGIGFILAQGFQVEHPGPRWWLETAEVWRCETGGWDHREFSELLIYDSLDERFWPRLARQTRISVREWRPATFFFSQDDWAKATQRIRDHKPGSVLSQAIERSKSVPELRDAVERLEARWRSRMQSSKGRVQPKKEAVRISLPPKPAARQTVRLSLPPRRSTGKETVRIEYPPSPGTDPIAPSPGEAKPPAGKLAALKKWFRDMFRKGVRPRRAASLDAIQSALSKLTPEERAELERFLRRFKPPEDPPPA